MTMNAAEVKFSQGGYILTGGVMSLQRLCVWMSFECPDGPRPSPMSRGNQGRGGGEGGEGGEGERKKRGAQTAAREEPCTWWRKKEEIMALS